MNINRRQFIESMGALTALGIVNPSIAAYPAWCKTEAGWTPHPSDLAQAATFQHGVASGDPLLHRVILWTRITPKSGARLIRVRVNVATDRKMKNVVRVFNTYAERLRDYTVKLDADQLKPGTTYFYQFYAQGEASPIGRTRTLPRETDRVRFGLASCSNYPFGYFAAYGHLAKKRNLDAIVHVGDYIYEYGNGEYGDGTAIGRIPSPDAETVELADYRWRYGQYRMDPDLQEAHRLHPWIVTWDDHESANDAYQGGAENHDAGEGKWKSRKFASRQAWLEWLPVRDTGDLRMRTGRIFRRFRYGTLAQLDILDTRIYGREEQVPALFDFNTQQLLVSPEELLGIHLPELARTNRQLLGVKQEQWLYKQIAEAEARGVQWQVLGQQVMMGQLAVEAQPGLRLPINTDQWDGYPAARAKLLSTLGAQKVDNTLILTGDFHSSWCNEVSLDPYDNKVYDPTTSAGSQAVEFVCPGITSPFFTSPDPVAQKTLEQTAMALNPHTRYVDVEHNGYVLLDIDRHRTRGKWYHLDDRTDPQSGETLAAVVEVDDGSNRAVVVKGSVS